MRPSTCRARVQVILTSFKRGNNIGRIGGPLGISQALPPSGGRNQPHEGKCCSHQQVLEEKDKRKKKKTKKILKTAKIRQDIVWEIDLMMRYAPLCLVNRTLSVQLHLHKSVKDAFFDLLSDSNESLQPNMHK